MSTSIRRVKTKAYKRNTFFGIALLLGGLAFGVFADGGIIFGLLVAGLGGWLLFASTRTWWMRRRVGSPELLIDKTELKVGESFSVAFNNTFPRSVSLTTLQIQLLFKESATYQQGTDTRTVHHEEVIDERELPGGQYTAGSFLAESFTLQIPPDAMHTLDAYRNKLRWLVKVKMVIPSLKDYEDEVELLVLPALAE